MAWRIWDAFGNHYRYLPHLFFEFGNCHLRQNDFTDVNRLFELYFYHLGDWLFDDPFNFNFGLDILSNCFRYFNRGLDYTVYVDDSGNVNDFFNFD